MPELPDLPSDEFTPEFIDHFTSMIGKVDKAISASLIDHLGERPDAWTGVGHLMLSLQGLLTVVLGGPDESPPPEQVATTLVTVLTGILMTFAQHPLGQQAMRRAEMEQLRNRGLIPKEE